MDPWLIAALVALTLAAVFVVVVILGGIKRKRAEADKAKAEADEARAEKARREAKANKSPVDLMVGGTVMYDEEWYDVKGSVTYRDAEGYEWFEYRLQNVDHPTKRVWLGAEKAEDWEFSLWENVANRNDLPDSPSRKSFEFAGVKYERDEKGTAIYTVEGQTDLKHKSGSVEYADYVGSDGSMISYERFDGGIWEASTGQFCDPAKIVDLPKPVG